MIWATTRVAQIYVVPRITRRAEPWYNLGVSKAKLYRVEGIVLRRREHGEADHIITLLTPEGRVELLARGVRKIRSRKAGHLELFCRTTLLARRSKSSWDNISQAEATTVRAGLQENFTRGTYARYVVELVLRFFAGDADAALFTLVDTTLELLEEAEDPQRVIRWYEQHLLILAGFRPEWGACVAEQEGKPCGAPLRPRPDDRRPYGVAPDRGGALCPDCFAARQGEGMVGQLSPSALSWLQALQRQDYESVAGLTFPAQTAAELTHVMARYISYHLERRPVVLRALRGNRQIRGVRSEE